MSDIIIKVENLGKKYTIGHQAQGGWNPNRGNYVALRDVVANGVKSLGKRLLGKGEKPSYTKEEFWALKDINFEVKQGEVVGIIGRNGAGKSTLLKILSRITEPTTGRVELRGRVASLLEVGTGFHPELTGRENIYLNGSILGMNRIEIRKKFDEIVAFAEVERFLDTPVKRYSSGMYVRLAFAVAAHLEPEILVVDEVLAVGDASFQKKCLGKMENVAKNEGRTVLFVSHNMGIINTLCKTSLWLANGEIYGEGLTLEVVNQYLNFDISKSGIMFFKAQNKKFCFEKLSLKNQNEEISSRFDVKEAIKIRIKYRVVENIKDLEVGFRIKNSLGIIIFTVERSLCISQNIKIGSYLAEVEIPALFLAPDHYTISLSSYIPNIEMIDFHDSILHFEIEETGSQMFKYKGLDFGVVLANFQWTESQEFD